MVHTVSQRNNGEMVSLQLVLTEGEQSLRMCANDVPSITLSMLLTASCLVWLAFGEENKLNSYLPKALSLLRCVCIMKQLQRQHISD